MTAQIIAIANQKDGKTTTCANLGIGLAQAGKKVLIDQPILLGEGILHHPEGVDLMPADIQLSGMEVSLVNAMMLEPGGINHSESSRNNQSELIRNSQCTCLADRLPTVIQWDR